MCPGMGEAGSLTEAGMRRPGFAEHGALGSGAVAGGAVEALGRWGSGVAGTLGPALQMAGRTVGSALRTSSIKESYQ